MRRTLTAVLGAAALAAAVLAAPAASAAPDSGTGGPRFDGETTKSVLPARVKSQAGKNSGGLPISYRGGPVMTGANGTNVYIVWYGQTWTTSQQSLLKTFLGGIGGSPYFGINSAYYDGAGKKVVNKVTVAGEVTAPFVGTSLTDAQIQSLVTDRISAGQLPSDKDGVYFLLTSAGVTASSGFLTQYCGWHNWTSLSGSSIKYSFVGNAAGPSLGNCAAQTTSSPNGDAGVDAMVSVVAHELEEAVTDPQLNAWYDNRGYENADKCAWTFGTTYTTSNGSVANMSLGGKNWLVQQNWRLTSQNCGLKA